MVGHTHTVILGYPILIGVNVGSEGVAFKCFTVNVRNEQDEAFLGFLDSDMFKVGLRLASTVQPAIAPFSQMVLGLTKSIATRHRNVPVQDFYLGLDFSVLPMLVRLAEGSYLAVQIPETLQTVWDWSEVGVQPGQWPSGEQGRADPVNPSQLRSLRRQPPGQAVSHRSAPPRCFAHRGTPAINEPPFLADLGVDD